MEWNLEVRKMIMKSTLENLVLSRMVLESDKDRAAEQGVSAEELQGMNLGPVLMAHAVAQRVWQNVHKLGGLKQTGGTGRKRFWACMNLLMREGFIEGEVGAHPVEMGWKDTAAEIERLIQVSQKLRRERLLEDGDLPALEDRVQSGDSEDEEENGGRDYEEAAEIAAEVGAADTKEQEGKGVRVTATVM